MCELPCRERPVRMHWIYYSPRLHGGHQGNLIDPCVVLSATFYADYQNGCTLELCDWHVVDIWTLRTHTSVVFRYQRRSVQLFWCFPFQMLLRLRKVQTLNPHAKASITAVLKEKDYPWRSSPAAVRHYQLWSDLQTAVDLHSSSNYYLDWSCPVALSRPPLKWIQIRGNISQLQWQTLKSNHRLKQIIDLKGV